MSGFYNNWVKVQNPTMSNNITPMVSGGFQTPFFFGGSQVPSNLGLSDLDISGKGLEDYSKMNFKPILKGKEIQSTNFHKHSNIHLPRYTKSI